MQYKILFVKNRYTKSIKTLIKDYLKLMKNTPFEVSYDEISTDFDVVPEAVSNVKFKVSICNGEDLLPKLRSIIPENKYNLVVFIPDNNNLGIRPHGVCNGANRQYNLYKNTELVQLFKISATTLFHETEHGFFAKLNRLGINVNDRLDTYLTGIETMVLEDFKPYWDKICEFSITNQSTNTPNHIFKYKYFSEKEIYGLKPELVEKLDIARETAGVPFKITSGFRTHEHNEEVGGVENSAHTSGLAVDIVCKTSEQRYKMIKSALENGITRIGVGSTFCHFDIDKTKPQNVIWLYV